MSGVSGNVLSLFGPCFLVLLVFFLGCMCFTIKHVIGPSSLAYQYYVFSMLFAVIFYGDKGGFWQVEDDQMILTVDLSSSFLEQFSVACLGFHFVKQDELKDLRNYYKICLAYSSNALEGNMLTESGTKVILEDGLTIGGKPLRDHLEVVGHSQAFDYMYKLVKQKTISEWNIKYMHKLFFRVIDKEKAGVYIVNDKFLLQVHNIII